MIMIVTEGLHLHGRLGLECEADEAGEVLVAGAATVAAVVTLRQLRRSGLSASSIAKARATRGRDNSLGSRQLGSLHS